MDTAVLTGDSHLTAQLDKHVTLIGTVASEPDVRDNGVHEVVIGTPTIPVRAGVLVQAPPHANVSYGDEVRAVGTLVLPQAFDTGEGRQFDYPDYLAASGISYTLSFAEIKSDGKNTGNILQALAINVKEA